MRVVVAAGPLFWPLGVPRAALLEICWPCDRGVGAVMWLRGRSPRSHTAAGDLDGRLTTRANPNTPNPICLRVHVLNMHCNTQRPVQLHLTCTMLHISNEIGNYLLVFG